MVDCEAAHFIELRHRLLLIYRKARARSEESPQDFQAAVLKGDCYASMLTRWLTATVCATFGYSGVSKSSNVTGAADWSGESCGNVVPRRHAHTEPTTGRHFVSTSLTAFKSSC